MTGRNDPGDPRRCERCGAFLWVAEEGFFCGDCGVLMPCTMRVVPPPVGAVLPPNSTDGDPIGSDARISAARGSRERPRR